MKAESIITGLCVILGLFLGFYLFQVYWYQSWIIPIMMIFCFVLGSFLGKMIDDQGQNRQTSKREGKKNQLWKSEIVPNTLIVSHTKGVIGLTGLLLKSIPHQSSKRKALLRLQNQYAFTIINYHGGTCLSIEYKLSGVNWNKTNDERKKQYITQISKHFDDVKKTLQSTLIGINTRTLSFEEVKELYGYNSALSLQNIVDIQENLETSANDYQNFDNDSDGYMIDEEALETLLPQLDDVESSPKNNFSSDIEEDFIAPEKPIQTPRDRYEVKLEEDEPVEEIADIEEENQVVTIENTEEEYEEPIIEFEDSMVGTIDDLVNDLSNDIKKLEERKKATVENGK